MKNLLLLFLACCCTALTAQQWTQVSSVPNNFRTDHSFGFGLNGKGYLVTGSDGNQFYDDFYEYDPATDTWTQKDDFPGGARGFAIGDIHDGKAYFGFGNGNTGRLNDLWVFDPITDEWTELASCTCLARTHPAMVAVGGKIFVGLGGTPNGDSNDWWMYDIATDTWEQRASFPDLNRHHPYQFHDGTYAYVGFGHGGPNIFDEWYKYDHINDTWEQMATLPAEGRVAGTQFSYKGLGFVLSGDGDNHSYMETGEFWLYYPDQDVWEELPPHPGRSRWAPASFILNDEVYIINGYNTVDNYFDSVYKFSLEQVTEPRLRLDVADKILLDGNPSAEYCDDSQVETIRVTTPFVFADDVSLTIGVDPSSTAIEGRDFQLQQTTGVLPGGSRELMFDIIVFDDDVATGDKSLVLTLTSDALVQTPTTTVTIVDNDKSIDLSANESVASFGTATTTNDLVLNGYYTDGRTQMLYSKAILEGMGLSAGDLTSLALEVTSKQSSIPYNNFRISIANTTSTALNAINNVTSMTDVYSGTYNSSSGRQTFTFDAPFAYEGNGLLIQVCFDNGQFTLSDPVEVTEVDYASFVSVYVDGVSNCSFNGNVATGSILADITFTSSMAPTLYSTVGTDFTTSLLPDETAYFLTADSIYGAVAASSVETCVSSRLVSATDQIVTEDDLQWVDRVYEFDTDVVGLEMEVTLLMPQSAEIDYNSDKLTGLFSTSAGNMDWSEVEVIRQEENDNFVSITIPYQGIGLYTVGVEGNSTSTDDLNAELIYDQVLVHDIAGRLVAKSLTATKDNTLKTGLYLTSYLYEGKVIRTEKVVVP